MFDKEHQKEIDLLKQQHQQELQQNKKENDSLKQQLEMMTKKYDELVNKLAENQLLQLIPLIEIHIIMATIMLFK